MSLLGFLWVWIAFCVGHYVGEQAEAFSWRKQADYDTPRYSGKYFWRVLPEEAYLKLLRRARQKQEEL